LKRVVAEVMKAGHRSTSMASAANREEESGIVSRSRGILGISFEEPLSVSDLARRTDCSVSRLTRLLRRHTGWSPHRYQVELRLREAVARLALSAAELSPIAHDLGFSSHSHFTYCFRRRFGFCPSLLRRAAKESNLSLLAGRSVRGR
ncbi:MAG TPA: AraC family transcriptional regulator, partial [Thermoanaerobaculia bacterium]|nr:AraC family transcriptional regulator [Thermoanaerobaculia bacterium]